MATNHGQRPAAKRISGDPWSKSIVFARIAPDIGNRDPRGSLTIRER
jgi:hypothetical protein